jgi:hypothetical protein
MLHGHLPTPINSRININFQRADIQDMSGSGPGVFRMCAMAQLCALDHALVSPSGGSLHCVTSFLVLPDIMRTSDLIAVVPRSLVIRGEGLAVLELRWVRRASTEAMD